MSQKIPLVILAGNDPQHGPVPPELDAEEMLSGFKGILLLKPGLCLVAELIDRYRKSNRFQDPLLLGPQALYQDLVDCEIVNVTGTLADTLRCFQHQVQKRWPTKTPVAVSACDILPTTANIVELLESGYDPHPGCQFWWQMITAEPQDLGPSAWKPNYKIRLGRATAPQSLYPGHLVIFRPQAVRLELWIRLMTLAYRYRNLPLRKRLLPWLIRGIASLAAQDIRNLGKAQLPVMTFQIPWHILKAFTEFQRKSLTIERFEQHIGRVVLHRKFRESANAVIVFPTHLLEFAKDIDSHREYRALT